MATDQRNLPAFFANDADFRAWGSGIAAQLAAIGLVRTADTGQINWSTVTKPAAINTAAGYEIWRFDDALQATKPVFIKIEYGVGGAVDRPSFWFTFGTQTNGAGTLGGQLSARNQSQSAGSKAAGVLLPSYCAGDASGFRLCTNMDAVSGNHGMLLACERTREINTGQVSDRSFFYILQAANGATVYRQIMNNGASPNQITGMPAIGIDLGSGGFSTSGNEVALSPFLIACGRLLTAPFWLYVHADIAAQLTPFQADTMGATRTLLPLGNSFRQSIVGANSNNGTAMLWE